MKKLLIAAALLVSTASQAAAPCCDCFNGLTVGIDALYMKPTTCPVFYADAGLEGSGSESEQVKNFANVGDADWGFHLYANYGCGCFDYELGYTWFESKTHAVSHRGNFDSIALPDQLPQVANDFHNHLKQRYQNLDLRAASDVCCSRCGTIYAYGNVRWAEIKLNQHVHIADQDPESTFDQSTRFCGGGLGVGVGANAPLWCGLGVHARLGVTAMVGEVKAGTLTSFQSANPTRTLTVEGASHTRFLPATDLRIGLDYTWVCQCLAISGQLGYQLDYYPQALILRANPYGCEDWGMGGLYFGISLGY